MGAAVGVGPDDGVQVVGCPSRALVRRRRGQELLLLVGVMMRRRQRQVLP